MLNRHPIGTTILTAVAGLAVAACSETPVNPVNPDLSLNTLGRDGGTVTVPMKVDATFMWIVDTEEECEDTPGLAEGFGSGEATHLGRFDVTKLDHCSVDIAAFLTDISGLSSPDDPAFRQALVDHLRREGEFAWTAADGSTLSGTYVTFMFPPPPPAEPGVFGEGASFTMTVTDGTGRFEGATGELEADLERSTFPFSDDPLFLEKATFPVVLEGDITIPRP